MSKKHPDLETIVCLVSLSLHYDKLKSHFT